MLSPPPYIGGLGLASRNLQAHRRAISGFFVRNARTLQFMAGRTRPQQWGPAPVDRYANLARSAAHLIGVRSGGLQQRLQESVMANHAQNPSVVRVENTEIPIIVYRDQRVITTELLAKIYGTDGNNIKVNLSRNKARFQEGVHYFKIAGAELKAMKNKVTQSNLVGRNAHHLILWTERGAARHAKMLDTDQAWSMFDKLEAAYFEPKAVSKAKPKPAPDPLLEHLQSMALAGHDVTEWLTVYQTLRLHLSHCTGALMLLRCEYLRGAPLSPEIVLQTLEHIGIAMPHRRRL